MNILKKLNSKEINIYNQIFKLKLLSFKKIYFAKKLGIYDLILFGVALKIYIIFKGEEGYIFIYYMFFY